MVAPLNILDRLHAQILDIVNVGLPLIAPSKHDSDLSGLAHLRGEMIALIDKYGAHIDQHILLPALDQTDPEVIRLACEIKASADALHAAYATFVERWTDRDGMLNWHEYRLSVVVLLKRIREHIQRASRWPIEASAACA